MIKYSNSKVLGLLLALVMLLLLCSWGPITHDSLAEEIGSQASDYYNNYRDGSFVAGCIAPDVALAAKPGTWDARQSMFHDGQYVDALLSLVNGKAERHKFALGYQVHLLCDGIESSYTAQKKAPVSSDFGVDKLVGASGGGNIPDSLLQFMFEAWVKAYPGDASVTLAWLKSAEGNFGLYMSGIYNPVSAADAAKYFSDYRAWYDQSVTESVTWLKAQNYVPAPPTTTIAPPPTTITYSTLPVTFLPGVNPVPPAPLPIQERPNFFTSIVRWFFSLFRR